MKTAILFDCEFLTTEGAMSRVWCGPYDPDPIVVQIGIVELSLEGKFPILMDEKLYVVPRDRKGETCKLDPFFTELTGINEETLTLYGLELDEALRCLKSLAKDAPLWSWGKDEMFALAISCYMSGLEPPLPAKRFNNACHLMLKAGVPYDTVKTLRSSTLASHFGIETHALAAHDALDDALSMAYAFQHLLEEEKLCAQDFHPNS